ncbi:hypothetical protein DWY99_12875 [[Clostridium] leptum]|uniref:Uncharacterized protein n=1 Tax=[Clostridium] leptum TaxID=1535 RepID=A0A412AUQ2_9FIRM|nr:hypothetical protein DWY99_12875 [[Clostridium] leptum]
MNGLDHFTKKRGLKKAQADCLRFYLCGAAAPLAEKSFMMEKSGLSFPEKNHAVPAVSICQIGGIMV